MSLFTATVNVVPAEINPGLNLQFGLIPGFIFGILSYLLPIFTGEETERGREEAR